MISRPSNIELFFKEVVEQFKRILEVAKNNTLIGIKKRLNFVDTPTATWTIADNPNTKSIDISIGTVALATAASGLADGDYGDIVVSGSGAAMDIDANTVGNTELRDSSALSVIGRSVNSVGDPADIVAASPGDVLRVAGGPPVLGFGSIPESSVTNLVTDLAGKVPTTRLINTTLPITGGGDLSADRTLAFDGSTLLDNNARVKVDKNGVGVETRRELNFIEGTNVTLTITDDLPNEKIDITIDAAGGAGTTISNFTITVPYVSLGYTANIVDATVDVTSKINIFPAYTPPTATNEPRVHIWVSDLKSGSFDVTIAGTYANDWLGGPYDFHYTVG